MGKIIRKLYEWKIAKIKFLSLRFKIMLYVRVFIHESICKISYGTENTLVQFFKENQIKTCPDMEKAVFFHINLIIFTVLNCFTYSCSYKHTFDA